MIGLGLLWRHLTILTLDHLKGRCQRIKPGHYLSSKPDLPFWVPQGSVLGSVRFTLYTTSLRNMISEHDLSQNLCAENSQLSSVSGETLLQHWMVYNRAWPMSNHACWWINWNWIEKKLISSLLRMNDSWANISLCFLLSFSVSELTLQNLLGILEWYLTKLHLVLTCIRGLQLVLYRYLWRICHFPDLNSSKLLANALVSIRLSAVHCCQVSLTLTSRRLQHVQNQLVHDVTKSIYSRIPLLHSIHRLPVKFRFGFKICL